MTNLFKKTLVAAAIMATTATVAYAAPTLTVGTGSKISKEGAASEKTIALPEVTITLDDEYAVNDRLVLVISGADVASVAGATLTDASGEITFGRLASDNANEAVFRITNIGLDVNGDTLPTKGNALTLSGITLKTASVVEDAGDVKVTYQGRLADGAVIETSKAATAIEVETQFKLGTVTPLSATIDVNFDRQQFAEDGKSDDKDSDTLTVGLKETGGLDLAATATTVTHTIFGDFSFVETNGKDGVDVKPTLSASNDSLSYKFDDTLTSVTITQGVVGDVDSPSITFNVAGQKAGNPIIEDQDFTATVSLAYLDNADKAGNSVLANEKSVGEWDLNGAQVFVPYLPVRFAGLQTRVVLTNDGSQDGEIEVEAFDEAGNSYGPVALGATLAGGTNMTVSSVDVADALGIDNSTKLTVTFTINAPKTDVTATGFSQKAGTGRQLIDVSVL